MDSHYANGSGKIPTTLRSDFVKKSENLEKAIRDNVTAIGGGQITPQRGRNMLIAVEYRPTADGMGTFNIIVGGKANQNDINRIKKALRAQIPKGHTVGTVIRVK